MAELSGVRGKRIVVTGGGGGLGSAMAMEFCRLGAQVLVCGRTESSLQAAVEAIDHEVGPNLAVATVCDVRDSSAVVDMVETAYQRLGGLDGLVNNASGLFPIRAEKLSPNGFRAVVEIVLQGTFNCTHEVGRRWLEDGTTGAVVNVLTPYAWTGGPGLVHTVSAKGGVLNLTRTLAVEWASRGVRVNALAPGWMPVGGTSTMVATVDAEQRLIDAIPAKRLLAPEETARAAAYLLSDDASYVNGHCLTIDGGHHLSKGLFEFVDELPSR